MSALYIGAGIDLRPFKFCEEINTFYYVDSLPNYPQGIIKNKNISNKKFIQNLNKKMEEEGIDLIEIKNDLRIYRKGKRKIYYYTNVVIPEQYEKISNINFEYLIASGHDPHNCIINNKFNLTLIGFDGTYYGTNDEKMNGEQEHENQLIYSLHLSNKIKNKFKSFIYYQTKLEKKGTFNSFNLFIDYINIF